MKFRNYPRVRMWEDLINWILGREKPTRKRKRKGGGIKSPGGFNNVGDNDKPNPTDRPEKRS